MLENEPPHHRVPRCWHFSERALIGYYHHLMYNPNGSAQFLNEFRETISSAAARLSELTPVQAARETAAGQWSPKEILGHLIDSANNSNISFAITWATCDII